MKLAATAGELGPGAAAIGAARSSSTETDDNGQSSIDLTKLGEREQPVRFAEPARIDCSELLHQDPRPLTVDFHLRPE